MCFRSWAIVYILANPTPWHRPCIKYVVHKVKCQLSHLLVIHQLPDHFFRQHSVCIGLPTLEGDQTEPADEEASCEDMEPAESSLEWKSSSFDLFSRHRQWSREKRLLLPISHFQAVKGEWRSQLAARPPSLNYLQSAQNRLGRLTLTCKKCLIW